ncbi:MAG: aspartate/tyrosine/aromatic aminotransferase [Phycisphaerae bacterium]|nr:aspartate/tyrosine/aromatic aminotransferase [Phycisphaerae bacterium]
MFEKIETAPPDPILGLTEAFRADPNPAKINLSVGVYQDASGVTPVLETVKEAEGRILGTEKSKAYKPITGDPDYDRRVQELMFGPGHELVESGRAVTAHTPGGTGALRVAGDYLRQNHPGARIWLSDPTWANHKGVFSAAGVETATYAYRDPAINGLDFDAMIAALQQVPAGDVVLLHGCCHNPTGIDPKLEQWDRVGEVLAERRLVALVDFAYQGFADGVEEDAAGLRRLSDRVDELIVCSSFSKNFGLYNERTGALTLVTGDRETAGRVISQVKVCIRRNYSNPPAHGGAIVSTILADADLRARWETEVAGMRDRINGMRQLFVQTLAAKGVDRDFSFIVDQRGMFSFSGLSPEQVDTLRQDHSIYIVRSGRINVAGMNESNADALCGAIASVL